MTFTFDATLSTDLALVRFHTGDTHSEGYYLTDETIGALITLEGSVGGAVIACLKYIITQLSSPDFRTDWLTVSKEQAREGYEKLLKQKALEFGISATGVVATSTISLPYRADSYQDSSESVYDGTP
jgi:hypothetical protein